MRETVRLLESVSLFQLELIKRWIITSLKYRSGGPEVGYLAGTSSANDKRLFKKQQRRLRVGVIV